MNFQKIAYIGAFGDSFGWLTSLMSALAFWGVYRTLQLQMAEIERVKKQVEEQSKKERQQSFENTFFNLTNTLQNIIGDMLFYDSKMQKDFEGRIVFVKYYEKLHGDISGKEILSLLDGNSEDVNRAKRILKRVSTSFFEKRTQYIGHYFRYFISTIGYIENGVIDDDDKKKYINIMKSQLSNYEMVIMFYYALTDSGANLKDAIERFTLFEYFPLDKLLARNQTKMFSDSAWKF
ncbi:putative phage abortive infection protein [Kosakonia sacchari]|uniref:putative phage abortive infection protein n=1 Tax=Kosakonia sacchari TaxID=1158459 RepID=UPI0013621098|nr:putative phage abortive infection protein [Kosakonia sacchari]